ncbi:MAG: hypothetical protein A3F68_07615 [Acidobacteria bacterium RIFCSPLOWO2_12_FULL_54_10]|nr:MAG: hypothetical protein A3F68_07615 [Acidobacteria bacterium RIFCSPLOWO2_12_FULL_54_10]
MEPSDKNLSKIASSGTQKRGLGRGLEALFPTMPLQSINQVDNGELIHNIEIGRISPNPVQPRQEFDQGKLMELAASIKVHGVMQPIVVRKKDDRYLLIAGERRWRASQLAGLRTVPAVVRDVPDDQVLELTLIENIQRENLNPIETAEAFARLASEANLTHEQIAERTGKNRASVTNYIRLLSLPAYIKKKVAADELTMGHAKALLSLTNEAAQKTIAARIVAQGLSVRQTELLVRETTPGTSKPITNKRRVKQALQDPNVRAAIEALERALGTKVQLEGNAKRGKVIIEYYTPEDLDRIYGMLMGK